MSSPSTKGRLKSCNGISTRSPHSSGHDLNSNGAVHGVSRSRPQWHGAEGPCRGRCIALVVCGIHVALGATRSKVTLAIPRRPLIQVGIGLVAGEVIGVLFSRMVAGTLHLSEIDKLAGYALLMLSVCLCACVVPVRRALAVQPTEALRQDG